MKKIVLFLTLSALLFATQKFLMPDEAFKPSALINEKAQIEAKIDIAKSIYLYADKVKFELVGSEDFTLEALSKPKSEVYHEDEVYLSSPQFLFALNSTQKSGVEEIKLRVSYQGCSKEGLCYEPLSKEFSFEVDVQKLNSQEPLKATRSAESTQELSESDMIANSISSGNIVITLLTFLGFGLLLALTPCVFPMIPIISGLIVSQGHGITTRKAFALSLVYVLSMALAYTIAGVLAGLFGSNLQAALQAPVVIYGFSLLFVALAMSMFGFYELKLPDAIVNKVSSSQNRSGYIGVAIMGFLSALIVGPCVAAPLAGALVYIGQTGDALLGGMALFSMSIGMGLPLILVGVSAGKFMPRPGAWMVMVNAIFGVMMLGVAIWMLEKVVDQYVTMLLYALLGIGFSIYLGVFEKESHFFKKSVSVVIFLYSVALFIGVLGGNTSMSKPLGFLNSCAKANVAQVQNPHKSFVTVKSIQELDGVLQKSRGERVLLDFSAEWCVACKELDELTFADEKVASKMDEFTLVRADLSENTQAQKELSKKYGVFGPPAILFFSKDGELLKSKSVVGYMEANKFLNHLNHL